MARGPGRSHSPALDTHQARDDQALRTACEDVSMGRWDGPRDLIAATGSNWDRRVFRLQILARLGVRMRWAETWAAAEPESADALVMLAHVQALRAILSGEGEGKELTEEAWQTCRWAADAAPADPSPWLVLMALTRSLAPDGSLMRQLWAEVRARDPFSREGHHEVLAYLMPRGQGSTTLMFDWAHERAHEAPHGTPISTLLLVAHAEYYRHRLEQNPRNYGLTIHPWVECPEIDRVLNSWWHHRPPQPHANFMDDANYLVHALCFAGRHEEAFDVFQQIGPYATRLPWAYCGDAEQLFLSHRTRSEKSARSPRRRRFP